MLRDMAIDIPFLGLTLASLWLMPLIVAFGVTCGANATNLLDGFNGLSTGLTLISASALAIVAAVEWRPEALWILLPLIGALSAFLVFNSYPAKVFPGDTFTLFAGGAIASAALISGLALWGVVLFIPMIADFAIKFRFIMTRGFKHRNQGRVDPDGLLHPPGTRVETLTHAVLRLRPMKEWQLVGLLWLVELGIGVAVIAAI
jgi:UDP-N-acetylglucosamine--dolichyl-phosphate N-acetylglucosaminephosphotransferase